MSDSESTENNIEKYKYNTETYMKEVMKIDEEYVDNMFDFYKKSITEYTMSVDQQFITPYRKKLISLAKNEIKINKDGTLWDEDNNTTGANTSIFSAKANYNLYDNATGMFIYMCLQYEEDSLVDEYELKYNFNNFPKHKLNDELYKVIPQQRKTFSEKFDSKKNDQPTEPVTLKIVENVMDYVLNKSLQHLVLCEWKDHKAMVKLSIDITNPAIDVIDNIIKNKTKDISIIYPTGISYFNTLRGSEIIKIKINSWKLV